MIQLFEKLVARAWNGFANPAPVKTQGATQDLGAAVVEEQITRTRVTIPRGKRAEHEAVLGRTGTGKTSLLRHLAEQDVDDNLGFLFFDLHGDTTAFLLKLIARAETRRRTDVSTKLIVIEPGDEDWSVGLNVLERGTGAQTFRQVSEFTEILKRRWNLDQLGPRTEELLRNTLHLLADNNLTLIETTPLLTNEAFRSACLRNSTNAEVQSYFRHRFDQASEAMQSVLRDPVLNKVSGFVADPRFRHIVGQRRSTFSLLDAIDNGYWVILNLDKGRLGDDAITLAALLLTKLKNALFARRRRELFTLYCDELQNLASYDSGLDLLFSEARKFSVGIVSANQFLEQYPPQMRAAVLAVGTQIFFQLSSADADKISAALDGGKKLAELLKNLPKRQMVVKSGHHRWRQAVVPTIAEPHFDYTELYDRCRARWARRRTDIEAEIQSGQQQTNQTSAEVLDGWE